MASVDRSIIAEKLDQTGFAGFDEGLGAAGDALIIE
jgi:hypothetical protein